MSCGVESPALVMSLSPLRHVWGGYLCEEFILGGRGESEPTGQRQAQSIAFPLSWINTHAHEEALLEYEKMALPGWFLVQIPLVAVNGLLHRE